LVLIANRTTAEFGPAVFGRDYSQRLMRWVEAQHWDKKPPAPALPDDVAARTGDKYREALRLLTEA